MALNQRIQSLKNRHAHIEAMLEHEEQRPAPDAAFINQLKKEKLLLKDELSRLETQDTQEAA